MGLYHQSFGPEYWFSTWDLDRVRYKRDCTA